MTIWTSDELNKVGNADELRVASQREDGTLKKSVIIWVVRLGNDLYIRSYKGRTSDWFRGVQARHMGHIQSGGVEKDVTFVEEANPEVISQVDSAYRAKYRRYEASIVESMLTPEARAATLKLLPRASAT